MEIIKYAYSNALEHEKVMAYYSPTSDATSKLILTCFCFFGRVNSNQFDWESQTDRQTEIEREKHMERGERAMKCILEQLAKWCLSI